MPDTTAAHRRKSFGAFQHRGFLFYWLSRLCATFAVNIVSVSVGWQVYDLTRDPFDLGLIGLVQFLPALLLVLVTGSVADRYNRRMIMALCLAGEALAVLALLAFTVSGSERVTIVFGVLLFFGIVRAFMGPAQQSLAPNLVPTQDLASAIAWNSSAWQIATIVGPVAGGLLYGVAPEASYGVALVMMILGAILILLVPKPAQKILGDKASWETVIAGFRYVWKEKIVLGAISLDLFAVLLGGATALMPVFARDILEVGPWGLGLLRAAPAVGALTVAAWLAFHPIRNHAGLLLFAFVTMFGLTTIVFGLSSIVWLSVVALVLMGASDMVSVYIRETLIQLWTPDAVRGRVNAVNMVFVGASNELGEFRAGMSAAAFGAVAAVVIGGAGTVAIAALWSRFFPDLRRARHLDGRT
ncbi:MULTISPECIES: MFS transporter [Kaistia]|uniref:MFS transporter n=1 Tax=Kaistia nematophila TaxID=2994654 RepID=A0A9X3E1G5_9HYPH|nr:MFS transporter [Kaistia nematophila]MBN9059727.1 MFS transporter [Hyphomicrobiales bacterium]MCX5569386.1 MFS transporter [Kaistia nematophila]